jgi:CheY-like chemotaxis protein
MARILIVDDELDVLRMVVRMLEGRGHTVDTATDGDAALALARQHRPEVVIIDVDLPRIDGYDVCRRLRADANTHAVGIVMMSAKDISIADASRPDRADEFVMKPFVRETLIRNVERLLGPGSSAQPA